jgi:hypothetical protein
MIKQNKEKTEVTGSKTDIMSEFTTLANSLYTNNVLTKDELMNCIRIATLSKEELEKEARAALENEIKKIFESLLFELVGGNDDDPS